MAYTRLNLEDYKHKWSADKVKHLEDGIVANENFAIENESDIQSLISRVDTLTNNVETIGGMAMMSMIDLWYGLISEGGKKCQAPTLSFDGNLTGKIILELPKEYSDDETTLQACYVRISENVLNQSNWYCVTVGGTVIPALTTTMMASTASTEEDFLSQLIFSAMTLTLTTRTSNHTYSCNYKQMESQIFPSTYQNLPWIFDQPTDFVYDNITYPKGTYVLYVQIKGAPAYGSTGAAILNGTMPYFFIDNIWNMDLVEAPLNKKTIEWEHLNFDSKYSFGFDSNGLVWDGEACFPSRLNFAKKVSTNPKAFLDAVKSASNITATMANGTSINCQLVEQNKKLSVLVDTNNSNSILAMIVLNLQNTNMEQDLILAPGVYFPETENYITHMSFEGINLEKTLINKVPANLIDLPFFDLTRISPIVPLSGNWASTSIAVPGILEAVASGLPVRIKGECEEVGIGILTYTFNYRESSDTYQGTASFYVGSAGFIDCVCEVNNSGIVSMKMHMRGA